MVLDFVSCFWKGSQNAFKKTIFAIFCKFFGSTFKCNFLSHLLMLFCEVVGARRAGKILSLRIFFFRIQKYSNIVIYSIYRILPIFLIESMIYNGNIFGKYLRKLYILSRSSLRRHDYIHIDEKSYTCPDCEKYISSKNTFSGHY